MVRPKKNIKTFVATYKYIIRTYAGPFLSLILINICPVLYEDTFLPGYIVSLKIPVHARLINNYSSQAPAIVVGCSLTFS